MTTTLAIALGLLLDRLFGEVPRWHPLVGFGRLANAVERRLNAGGARRLRGVLGLFLLGTPPALVAWELRRFGATWLVDGIALYFALGWRALAEHAEAVAKPLAHGDLPEARSRVGFIVSRETASMDEEAAARATVESVLENGNDAIFGAIFWCVLAGAAGVIVFRLANTLDAMWGYKNVRFLRFGWATARFDDLLNLIPARLTALTYALLGKTAVALRCWREQAPAWSSPNAGPVMAAGAGSLGLQLGGAAVYEGEIEERPLLGHGQRATAADISRAMVLITRSVLLWLLLIGLVDALL